MPRKTSTSSMEDRIEKNLEQKLSRGHHCQKNVTKNITVSDSIYCLGFIGAAIYYLSLAPTFWTGVLGLLKAAFWPAFLVYEALQFLAG